MEKTWMTDPAMPEALLARRDVMHKGKQQRGVLQKFNHDKLGMFIHWGLYSIPSGCWNGQDVWG